MRLTDPLNDRQLEVLRWIDEGCPQGVTTGSTYKKSAQALQDRWLVKISKTDDSWSAAVTDMGHYDLKHGAFPPKSAALSGAPMFMPGRGQAAGPTRWPRSC